MSGERIPQRNYGTAYVLWLFCLLSVFGIHRIYAGRYLSGFLYIFTFGFLGLGQFLDLFLIPNMIDEKNLKAKALYGYQPNQASFYGTAQSLVINLPQESSLEAQREGNSQNTLEQQDKQEFERKLKLAYSYLEDSASLLSSIDYLHELKFRQEQIFVILHDLKLANKNIKEIERVEPVLETTKENSEGKIIKFSTRSLKAIAFYLEGTYRLVLGQKKKGIKLCRRSLSLMPDSENQVKVYQVLSVGYKWKGEKSKCLEMLEKARKITKDESRYIEIEKELDKYQETSLILFKLNAFKESWLALSLVLIGIIFVSFLMLVVGQVDSATIVLIVGTVSCLFWWWNIGGKIYIKLLIRRLNSLA